MALIYLEGPSGFGKSFISKKLANHGIGRGIGEYHNYLRKGEKFSNINAQNKKELNVSRKSLQKLIINRNQDIIKALTFSNYFFAERSPVTFLYTEIARKKHGLHANIKEMSQMILDTISDDEDIENYVILNLPVAKAIKRIEQERTNLGSFFYHPSVLKNIVSTLNYFSENYLSKDTHLKISSDQDISLISKKIKEFSQEIQESKSNLYTKTPVKNFCKDIINGLDIYSIK